ncbi:MULTISPECIES: tripartite tricarboxylate transporter substrate binding protein [unclassified Polynucleobacter]|uniref:Bug family tripartite tricarboxylate transporter substrate binding protein n=1 Tax=unclassified Polynucleobacter TaxID=2640945 RepID=UPI001BFD3208|nr:MULTISPECIES: tripartite tricarboxylate transporter substrate binding protein [unclassified Polynucleobacter]MBU3559619.1 tripartite tricarboxylate transporter substrate binding protein [Polynucleobacter sp. Nonnen-W13]QWE30303.1 tripartite tricarboxylate transporter substrate binding protein [Polynucleobacter sp. Adler-ghost]
MSNTLRRQMPIFLSALIFSSISSVASFNAAAQSIQNYPVKPIKLIAPVAAGGGLDNIARSLAEKMSKSIGQTIVVENIGGGGGTIASQSVAKATPDGYTLMVAYVGSHGTNPAVRKLPYDAIKDFTAIGMIGATPNALVINPELPIKNFKEFIDYAKKNPDKISYGSAGPGTLTHLGMEQLKLAAGISMVHVPYRGVGPAYTDLLAGQTQAMLPTLFAAMPYLNTNRVRGLAITGAKRNPAAPNIPTFKELGYNGFDGQQWYGIVGPANLPPAIVKKLNSELNKALALPDFSEKMTSEAMTLMPMSPQQFENYIKEDIARWVKVAKERSIELE